jgi:hypothetical protein
VSLLKFHSKETAGSCRFNKTKHSSQSESCPPETSGTAFGNVFRSPRRYICITSIFFQLSSRTLKMTIDLYYLPLSSPCRSVLLTANAVGVQLNLKYLDLFKGEHLTPEFLKVCVQPVSWTLTFIFHEKIEWGSWVRIPLQAWLYALVCLRVWGVRSAKWIHFAASKDYSVESL